MLIPILATKLFIPPPRPNLVLRPRLINLLNENLNHAPGVVLISAPAGFGKTTLITEWITQFERPIAWLSLDEGDNDLTRFLAYLVAALQTIAPMIGKKVKGVFQSPQPLPFETILTALLNEIIAIPDHFVLVLEDFHVIDSRPVDQALTFLLEHLPPRMTMVLTTREDPNLPLARLRARGQLTELRAADLRFTPTEASAFLDQMMGLNLSAEDIAALEYRTEGWIAGLQLAALALQGTSSVEGQKDAANFIKSFTGTHHFVMDYLIEEVLQQQSEKVHNFLLRTSILDRMCGTLSDAVLLDPSVNGQEILEFIDCANLFIFPLDNERHWYRYHSLFVDLLRQRLSQRQTPEEIAQYHISASQWFEKNGDLAEAFRHLIAAEEYSRAAGLVERSWQGMNASLQSAIWLDWVKQLPEELICSRPVLCTQIAWGLMDTHDFDASETRLRDAEQCMEGPSDEMIIVDHEQFRTLPARITFIRAYNAQTRQDFVSTVKYAELVFKLLPEEDNFLRAQTTAILGGTYWTNGDLNKACKSLSDWIESSIKVGNYFFAIAGASGMADILIAQGHLNEALKTTMRALQLASEHKIDAQRVIAPHYLEMAMLSHEMGDDKSVEQFIKKSLVLGDQSLNLDWNYRKCRALACLKESEGELEAALELLDEAKSYFVKTLIPYTRPIEAVKARIYLKQGRLSKAKEWVNKHHLAVDDDLTYLHEFEHIILARVLLAEYQSNHAEHVILEALNLLENLLQAADDAKRMGSALEILLTQALVYHAQGCTSQASASLQRALTLAEPEGFSRIFIDEGECMRSLLSNFRVSIEKHPRSDTYELKKYIDSLLSAFPHPKGKLKSGKIESLSHRELEVLRLITQGLSNRDISERLFLALSSVKGHNQMIFSKLQVQSRTEAIVRAHELGIL